MSTSEWTYGRVSRARFLKLSGAGLAGAALFGVSGVAAAQTPASSYIDYQEFSGGAGPGTVETPVSFDTLIPSFEAEFSSGGSLELQLRVRYGGSWSGWLSLGPYLPTGQSASASTSLTDWQINVDTLGSRRGERADAYQYRLVSDGEPTVRKVALVASDSSRHGRQIEVGNLKRVWGKDLATPLRSQYDYEDGGEVWCSPTSVNMLMGYHGLNEGVINTADGVYDASYGWGNWSFNTAYAGHRGLEASVSRFNSVQQLERWIDADLPVIASIAWDNRTSGQQLDNAALTWSNGHLLVVRGFTSSGDVITSDPAGSPRSEVRRVYDRAQLERAWISGSGGVVYLIYPQGRGIPGSYAANGSW